MNRKIEILFLTLTIFLFITFFSISTLAFSLPQATSYKINGKQESARINPSQGDVANIEISANVPVKFSTIAICLQSDLICNRATAVKYFTKTDAFVLSVNRDWNGKTSKDAVAAGGDYRIKVTMKDEGGIEKIQELTPYLITVDSPVSNVSSSLNSKSSIDFESFSSQSQFASLSSSANSQSNLDNDPVVKKIRDFINSGGERSVGVPASAQKDMVKKASSDKKIKENMEEIKATNPKDEEMISLSANQEATLVSDAISIHPGFLRRILNLPFAGYNLVKNLFYSGN